MSKSQANPMEGCIVRFMCKKHHKWRGKYERMFVLTKTHIVNVDPSNWNVTNTWAYQPDVVSFSPSVTSESEFTLTIKDGRKNSVVKFSCLDRTRLLNAISRLKPLATNLKPFIAVKITRTGLKLKCVLGAAPYGIVHYSPNMELVSTYLYKDITKVQLVGDDPTAFVFFTVGRPRMFASPDRAEFLRLVGAGLTSLGRSEVKTNLQITKAEYRNVRGMYGNEAHAKLGEYDVLKITRRHPTPIARRLIVTETTLVERDAKSYGVVSCRPVNTILNLVRFWNEPQKLAVEYQDSSRRIYISSHRDQLLGVLLDAARNADNKVVSLRPTPAERGMRLISPNVESDPMIEVMLLKRLLSVIKSSAGATHGAPYNTALVHAGKEFACNIPPRGLPYNTKKSQVMPVLLAMTAQFATVSRIPEIPGAVLVDTMQCLQRLVTAKEAYKTFVTLSDSVEAIQRVLRVEDDGVIFAACELLRQLVSNPRRPENTDNEYEANNKKLILTHGLTQRLLDLLDSHSGAGLGAAAASATGTLVMMSVVGILDNVLVSGADTSSSSLINDLLARVGSRYACVCVCVCVCVGGWWGGGGCAQASCFQFVLRVCLCDACVLDCVLFLFVCVRFSDTRRCCRCSVQTAPPLQRAPRW